MLFSMHFFSNFTLDMDPIFGAISAVDHADCGKLLVCNVVAKTQNELTTEEDLLGKVIYPKYNKHCFQADWVVWVLLKICGFLLKYSKTYCILFIFFMCKQKYDNVGFLTKKKNCKFCRSKQAKSATIYCNNIL